MKTALSYKHSFSQVKVSVIKRHLCEYFGCGHSLCKMKIAVFANQSKQL